MLFEETEEPELICVLFCDLDDTLMIKGKAAGNFRSYWNGYERKNNAALVYNTGRPMHFVARKIHEGELPPAEFVIANQGMNIYCNGQLWQPWVNRMRRLNFTIR